MIVLVSIPHRARPNWWPYFDEIELCQEAHPLAVEYGMEEPTTAEEAAKVLAADWHNYILVHNEKDADSLKDYKGHGKHAVRAFAEEIQEEFRWGTEKTVATE